MQKVKSKINIADILLIISFMTTGFGTFNDILPLNFSQIIIIILFFYVLLNRFMKKKLHIPITMILLFIYIIFITFVINSNGIESIKTTGILLIYIFTLYFYTKEIKDYNKIIDILYNVSFIFSIIAIIQEVGYILNIKIFFDYSYLGINNAVSITGKFMRVTSLMTEPAHLSSILLPGICIAVLGFFEKYSIKNNNKFKNITIIIASFLTFSLVVYATFIIAIILILTFVVKDLSKKIYMFLFTTLIFIIFIRVAGDSILIINDKINSLFTLNQLNTTNLSSFAVISNLQIAIEKLRDGYFLGTGIDSHSMYYFKYIHRIYYFNDIVMYLNYSDAASLYIRIFSEFGIVGFIFFISYLFKLLIVKKNNMDINKDMYLINRICIIGTVLYGVRQGGYISSYFLFIFILTIITNKKMKNIKSIIIK